MRELSRSAGLSAAGADVSRIENGKQPNPHYDKIKALAAALDVNPEWLWSGEGPRERRADTAERTVELDDPYPTRADAIARMKGAVSDEAIATVRGVQNLGGLTVQEWVDELLRADRLARKGREPEGREHEGIPHGRSIGAARQEAPAVWEDLPPIFCSTLTALLIWSIIALPHGAPTPPGRRRPTMRYELRHRLTTLVRILPRIGLADDAHALTRHMLLGDAPRWLLVSDFGREVLQSGTTWGPDCACQGAA